jgi:hypothetical protein
VKNGGESGVDCGGATACSRCAIGGGCAAGTDCLNGYCKAGSCWKPPGFLLTIDSTQVDANLTDFPVLVRITNPALSAARADGFDIIFSADGGSTPLAFQIEKWVQATGELVAWVKLPAVADLTNTVFYLRYADGGTTDRSTPTAVWTNAFRAVYHLNAAASGPQADSSGNNNPAAPDTTSCSGTCAPVSQPAGNIGSALTFGANASTRLIAADSNSLDITGQITVSAWVRLTTATYGTPQTVVSKRIRTTETCNYETGFWPNNSMYWMWGSGTEWPPIYASSPVAVPPQNQWAHVTWTVQGSPLGMRTYLNGVRINSTDQNLSSNVGGSYPVGRQLALNTNTQPLFIGGMDQETDEALIGDLDEVRIAATSRSAAWIAAEYNNQKSASTFLAVIAD